MRTSALRSLVGLVQDDDAVSVEVSLVQRLLKVQTVRHACFVVIQASSYVQRAVRELDLHFIFGATNMQPSNRMGVSHQRPELALHLLAQPFRDRRAEAVCT